MRDPPQAAPHRWEAVRKGEPIIITRRHAGVRLRREKPDVKPQRNEHLFASFLRESSISLLFARVAGLRSGVVCWEMHAGTCKGEHIMRLAQRKHRWMWILFVLAIPASSMADTVSGRVYGQDAKPLPNVTLVAKPAKGDTVEFKTNATGNFSVYLDPG